MQLAGNQEATFHAATAKEVAARLHEIGRPEAAADMLLAMGDAEVRCSGLGRAGLSYHVACIHPPCHMRKPISPLC